MSKLTAEKCREIIEECRTLKERGYLSINGDYKLQALEIALPILEQQERGEGEWIEWGGGECPISSDCIVEVKFRYVECQLAEEAFDFDWHHYGNASDIIAYRVIEGNA